MNQCPSCTREVPAGNLFCGSCGASVATPSVAPTRTAMQPLSDVAPRARSPMDERFPPGTLVAGRYRVVGLIGRGGMGEVYRADDLRLDRSVALKFLPAEVESDPRRLGRFLNEVRVALRVTHPHVCRVHDVGEMEGRRFISMEYVDGENLASLLRRIGRLPPDKAIQAARQLCAGLAAAHEQGILHRDLKPANVMLDGRGQVKIADFGLAALAGELRGEEIGAGTPAYMSPEQIAGSEVTERSDLYALGLVLYEIFTGRPAFEGTTPAELVRRRRTPPSSPSSHVEGIAEPIERVILRCLAEDPRDRPPSALAVAAALPGGDPLAAALAAGETPSPQLVAEAGPAGGLSPSLAAFFLVLSLLVTTAGIALSGRLVLARSVPLEKPPEALVERARDAIRAGGWDDRGEDSLFGFVPGRPEPGRLRVADATTLPENAPDAARPQGLFFVYRQSPKPLARQNAGALGDWFDDPPPTQPGMIETRLDTEGRLVLFAAVPPSEEETTSAGEPDWRALFAAAGLDPSALTAVEPGWTPRVWADRRIAWQGPSPFTAGDQIRVEAASFGGRPVSFVVLRAKEAGGAEGAVAAAPRSFWAGARELVSTFWFLFVLLGAGLVAIRNVRLRRGDREGTLRLALYLGAVRMVQLLGAHHVASTAEIDVLKGHVAWSLYYVGLAYVFYLALEPYARRLWPGVLVSWVRLLDGRLRDPLVGRDLLVGAAYGTTHALVLGLVHLSRLRSGTQGATLEAGFWSLEALRGLPHAISAVAGVHVESVLFALFGVMMFLVLRVLAGRTWIAMAVWVALSALLFNPLTGSPWPYLISLAILLPLFWIVFFRCGLLSVVTAMSVSFLLRSLPLTFDLSRWYADVTLLVLGAVVAVTGWGFWAALAGRPIFRDEIADLPAAGAPVQ